MKILRKITQYFFIFLILSTTIYAQAAERSRWDPKSFPRLPTVEKINKAIEGYQLPHTPEEGKALIYVVRPGWFLGLVRFGVYLNSKDASSKVGHNRTRQYIHFNVEPGEHTIFSRASNWAQINVNVEAGETIVIEQEQNAFVRNVLVLLSEAGGKYRIKKAKQGTVL